MSHDLLNTRLTNIFLMWMCLNKNLFLPNSSSIVAFTNEGRYQIVSDLTGVYIYFDSNYTFWYTLWRVLSCAVRVGKNNFWYCVSTEFFIVRITSKWSLWLLCKLSMIRNLSVSMWVPLWGTLRFHLIWFITIKIYLL